MQGYCVKCRAKKEIKDAKTITLKNGKPATQGVCPDCGTKVFRIGKSQTGCSLTELRRAGYSQHRDVQPFYFVNHTKQAIVR